MSEGTSAAPSAAPTSAPASAEASTPTSTESTQLETTSAQGQTDSEEMSEEEISALEQEPELETPSVKRYKVKIDGKEVEVDEGELLAGYQKSKGSSKRFEEAAKMKKYADQILEAVKNSPIEVLQQLGRDPKDIRKIAEDFLIQQMELENLTPEQKALREKEQELERYRKQEQERKAKEEQEHYAKVKAQYEDKIDGEIVEALQGSGLPPTTYTVKRMAQYLARSIDKDLGLTAKDVVKYVQKDYDTDLSSYLGGYEGDKLLSVLPKPVLDKIRKALVTKVKSKQPASPIKTEPVATAQTEQKQEKKPMTMAEFREWADNNK